MWQRFVLILVFVWFVVVSPRTGPSRIRRSEIGSWRDCSSSSEQTPANRQQRQAGTASRRSMPRG
eukprot:11225324-Lingulodinium_polyedra.AAC.1